MRLLDAKAILLEEFVGEVPPYAILSHTWGQEEVSFQDIHELSKRDLSSHEPNNHNLGSHKANKHEFGNPNLSSRDLGKHSTVRQKAGYLKIKQCCQQATTDGLDYVWVDTCCIDKTSSAELSEAINSMFQWYRNAAVCYAYLADVTATPESTPERSEFAGSRWFKRGWTLQELLAPAHVWFFSKN
jgi:hypothetical protein